MRISNEIKEYITLNAELSTLVDALSNKLVAEANAYLSSDKQYATKTAMMLYVSSLDTAYELAIKLLVTLQINVLSNSTNTVNNIVPQLANKIVSDLGRVENMKLALWIIHTTEYISHKLIRESVRDQYSVIPTFDIELFNIKELFPTPSYTLPEPWVNNYNTTYDKYDSHIILGSSLNRHKYNTCETIINQLQQVSYELTPMVDVPEEYDTTNKQLELFNTQRQSILNEYKGKPFYFYWQYDKRGRMYSRGYHINIQSNEYGKSLLQFSNKEKLTERGFYWLSVCIANHYGLDKLDIADRYEWFENNKDDILTNTDKYIVDADEPYLFQEAVRNYKLGLKGEKVGYIARLDSTSSGIQILSTLMRDEDAMHRTNVLNTNRADVYTEVAKELFSAFPNSNKWGDEKEARKVLKKPIMTHFYSSKNKPKEYLCELVDGEYVETDEYKYFIEILSKHYKGATRFMEACEECYKKSSKDVFTWTLPDGFVAYCPSITSKTIKLSSNSVGTNLSTSFIINNVEYSANNYRSLAPNITHSIDAYIAREVVHTMISYGYDISPIHDSFGVHPNHCDMLRTVYRRCLMEVYSRNYLDKISSELGLDIQLPDMDMNVSKAILANKEGHSIC